MSASEPNTDTHLRRLRKHLGLTQPDMAGRLGVKLSTYRAYEYGTLKKVPEKVALAARSLSIDPQYSYIQALYGGRPMRDVAHEWAQRMGIAKDSCTDLATALGVNKSTVSRWLDPQEAVQLSTEELIRYDRRVAQEEAYFLASRKRHGR